MGRRKVPGEQILRKKDIAVEIEYLLNVKPKRAKQLVDCVLHVLKEGLVRDRIVKIDGFGRFKFHTDKPHRGKLNGKWYMTREFTKVGFKPCVRLRMELRLLDGHNSTGTPDENA